jgi:type I restriction enzyme S subunit
MNARLLAEERLVALSKGVKSGLMDDLLTGRVRVTPLLA